MNGHRNRNIESVLFIKSKQKSEEESMMTSSRNSSTANHLNSDDSHVNSIVPRPICHVDNQCFCYEDRDDCTTCSTHNTDDSDVFMLESSESRSQAGSSSRDGSSLEIDDFHVKIPENSGFSMETSQISQLEPEAFDELLENLHQKVLELREEFDKNSETFGQMMAIHGFQRAIIGDKLTELDSEIAAEKSEIPQRVDILTNLFIEHELAHIMFEKCQMAHSHIRSGYLKRLMDDDIMQTNTVRIQELTEKIKNLGISEIGILKTSSTSTSSESSNLDLDKILDDVSTCQSFCPDDL